MNQPYSGFAKVMIEAQIYPNLIRRKKQPIPPYDVTAHSLALLTGTKVDKIYKSFPIPKESVKDSPIIPIGETDIQSILGKSGKIPKQNPSIYKSHIPSMDEGWTRWIFDDDRYSLIFFGLMPIKSPSENSDSNADINEDIKSDNLSSKTDVIIFPDQSPNQILNGYAKDAMPDEYTGGIGKEGVENLRKFVEAGGTLVFLNRASNFAIEHFDLPVKDVTKDLPRKDFYIPGSILRDGNRHDAPDCQRNAERINRVV